MKHKPRKIKLSRRKENSLEHQTAKSFILFSRGKGKTIDSLEELLKYTQ